jgi:putative transcriptional regulator
MKILNPVITMNILHQIKTLSYTLALGFLMLTVDNPVNAAETLHNTANPPGVQVKKGTFLVATENLAQSSFKETVILMTHFSALGATGLAINRPADIPLNDAFPDIQALKSYQDPLYLGGPVHSEAVFVLMQTERPHAGMKRIKENIYFAAGINAISHGLPKSVKGEFARAYVGYAGWGPGQLENEIDRGDWLVVETDARIVFEEDPKLLWERLHKSWSGSWI